MTQLLTLPDVAQSMGSLVGILGTAAGIRCIVAPKLFAKSFGLTNKENDEPSDFIPVVGARNIAIGLSILSLSFQGNLQAMGTVMLCGFASCAGDAIVVHQRGDPHAAGHHVIAGGVLGGLGLYLSLVA